MRLGPSIMMPSVPGWGSRPSALLLDFLVALSNQPMQAPLSGGFDISGSVTHFDTDGLRPQSSAERLLSNLRMGWRGEQDKVIWQLSDQTLTAQDPLGLSLQDFYRNPRGTDPSPLRSMPPEREIVRIVFALPMLTVLGVLKMTSSLESGSSAGDQLAFWAEPSSQSTLRSSGGV